MRSSLPLNLWTRAGGNDQGQEPNAVVTVVIHTGLNLTCWHSVRCVQCER